MLGEQQRQQFEGRCSDGFYKTMKLGPWNLERSAQNLKRSKSSIQSRFIPKWYAGWV